MTVMTVRNVTKGALFFKRLDMQLVKPLIRTDSSLYEKLVSWLFFTQFSMARKLRGGETAMDRNYKELAAVGVDVIPDAISTSDADALLQLASSIPVSRWQRDEEDTDGVKSWAAPGYRYCDLGDDGCLPAWLSPSSEATAAFSRLINRSTAAASLPTLSRCFVNRFEPTRKRGRPTLSVLRPHTDGTPGIPHESFIVAIRSKLCRLDSTDLSDLI